MRFEDSRVFDAPPDLVWEVITDTDLYAEVAPNLSRVEVLEGEGEGMVRECADTEGTAWTETCTAWEPGRRYAVEVHVEESPIHRPLFHSFAGEWAMEEREDGVLVTMRFDYEPRYGPFGWLLGKAGEREGGRLTRAIFDGWVYELEACRAPPTAES
jgi:ribosome-associated toxin RatA of RatAB toxin-antitoxin module